jgi:hypothetical protein
MSFHWTAAEVAVFAPSGVVLAGVIAYMAARQGSKEVLKAQRELRDSQVQLQRDLLEAQRLNQQRLIESQEAMHIDVLELKEQQELRTRESSLANSQLDAYAEILRVLLQLPPGPDEYFTVGQLRDFGRALSEWGQFFNLANVSMWQRLRPVALGRLIGMRHEMSSKLDYVRGPVREIDRVMHMNNVDESAPLFPSGSAPHSMVTRQFPLITDTYADLDNFVMASMRQLRDELTRLSSAGRR